MMDILEDKTVGVIGLWLYAGSGAILTLAAIYTLASIKPDTKAAEYSKERRDAFVFALLALVSLGLVSYNTSQALEQSFWLSRRSFVQSLLNDPLNAITSLRNSFNTSTPLTRLSLAIGGDDFGWLWAQSSLLKTFSVCLYMAYEGTKCSESLTYMAQRADH